MELWTEYEGRTIDGSFPLKRLLLPEGRSAFFATLNGAGNPTVIRLIESHFDEEEILARWRGVEALNHPNLLKLEQFGQLKLDETTVIYAVMEPVDANLGEVVAQQRITVAEARDLAASMASALEVLHTHGFVHEHLEPSNIFAVGDAVKLRSDCIREAPEGYQGVEAKRRDVRDLATVLLQTLTQQRTLEAAAHELPLPSPFEQIVRKGLSGEWGVAEIKAALPTAKRPVVAPPAAVEAAPAVAAPKRVASNGAAVGAVSPADAVKKAAVPAQAAVPVPLGVAARASKQIALPLAPPVAETKVAEETPYHEAPYLGRRLSFDEEPETRKISRPGLIAAGVLAAVLALGVGWHFVSKPAASTANQTPVTANAVPPASSQVGGGAASTGATTASKPSASKLSAGKPSARGTQEAQASRSNSKSGANHVQWRVVAFTFNHQDQAKKKVESIAKEHPQLRPEVFTISGRAPFLVTVGGAMDRDAAYAFVQRARKAGLPRDSYAQNYTSNGR